MRRLRAEGGADMINVSHSFVDPAVVKAMNAARAKLLPEYLKIKQDLASDPKKRDEAISKLFDAIPRRRTTWTNVIDHIEHVIQVAGPLAVGLGTDFDGIEDPPEGPDDVSSRPVITAELLRRGHSENVVEGVLGENFLHFFRRIQEIAHDLAGESPSTATLSPG